MNIESTVDFTRGLAMKYRIFLVPITCFFLIFSPAILSVAKVAERGQSYDLRKKQRLENWMNRQDKDEDGKISRNEAIGLIKSNFTRFDTNMDDCLDRDELAQLADRLARGGFGRNTRIIRPGNQKTMTTEQLLKQAPEGVAVLPDIAYREGNDAWKLDLAMPTKRGVKPRPAIVFIHGGGWSAGDKRRTSFIKPTLEFAAKGYVCVSVNYRLISAGKTTKIACVEDVKCSVRWLRAHARKYNVDPNCIGAYGNSAGAHLAAMLGLCPASAGMEGDGPWQEFSSMVQAVVCSATPTGPRLRYSSEEDEKKISPMTYVSNTAPPFLLIHEESDRLVPVANSDNFVKALRDAGAKDVTYMRYEDGSGHGVFLKNIKETGPAREAFFERTLRMKRAMISLKVDLALPKSEKDSTPVPGTLKSGWTPFVSRRWADMYMHDATWEDGSSGKNPPRTDGLDNTGVHVMLDCGSPGNGGFAVYGMSRDNLGGGGRPTGKPNGDAIANGWFHNIDWGGERTGDVLMRINGLPSGEYEMTFYHNHWEPRMQSTRNSLDQPSRMPNLPLVRAMPLPVQPLPGYRGWDIGTGTGKGVTSIQEDRDIDVTSVTADAKVGRSVIRFKTDGSNDVLVIIDGGNNDYPDPARRGREGSKAVLNALEIKQIKRSAAEGSG
jgi:acetyl esterase/lipase